MINKEKPYSNHNIPKTKRNIQACFEYAFSTLGEDITSPLPHMCRAYCKVFVDLAAGERTQNQVLHPPFRSRTDGRGADAGLGDFHVARFEPPLFPLPAPASRYGGLNRSSVFKPSTLSLPYAGSGLPGCSLSHFA